MIKSLEETISSLTKALEVEQAGEEEMATAWREIAEKQKLLADQLSRSIEAGEKHSKEEEERWGKTFNYNHSSDKGAGPCTQRAKDVLLKRIDSFTQAKEAALIGENEIAAVWYKIAEKQKIEADYWSIASKAYIDGDLKKVQFLVNTSTLDGSATIRVEEAIKILKESIESLKKSEQPEVAKNSEIADAWHEIALQQQRRAEQLSRVSQSYATGKDKELTRGRYEYFFDEKAASATSYSIEVLKKRLTSLIEAQKNQEDGAPSVANGWRYLAEKQKVKADQFREASEAYEVKNATEAERWEYGPGSSDDWRKGATTATNVGVTTITYFWKKRCCQCNSERYYCVRKTY